MATGPINPKVAALIDKLRPYAKAVVAVAGAVVIVAQAIAAPEADLVSVITAIVTALGVERVPNEEA